MMETIGVVLRSVVIIKRKGRESRTRVQLPQETLSSAAQGLLVKLSCSTLGYERGKNAKPIKTRLKNKVGKAPA